MRGAPGREGGRIDAHPHHRVAVGLEAFLHLFGDLAAIPSTCAAACCRRRKSSAAPDSRPPRSNRRRRRAAVCRQWLMGGKTSTARRSAHRQKPRPLAGEAPVPVGFGGDRGDLKICPNAKKHIGRLWRLIQINAASPDLTNFIAIVSSTTRENSSKCVRFLWWPSWP